MSEWRQRFARNAERRRSLWRTVGPWAWYLELSERRQQPELSEAARQRLAWLQFGVALPLTLIVGALWIMVVALWVGAEVLILVVSSVIAVITASLP